MIERLVIDITDDVMRTHYWGIDGKTYAGATNIAPLELQKGKQHYILLLPDATSIYDVTKHTRVTIIVEEEKNDQ